MATTNAPFRHLLADFLGVKPPQLRDLSLVSGLLIAAASAAGFSATAAPQVRALPSDGLTGLYLLDDCHIIVHTYPDRELLLLDILSPRTHDARKAIDVFARRLAAREVRTEARDRG